MGIRVALGATRGQVVWMILRSGILLCLTGAALGMPLVVASGKLLGSLLYGVSPTDPLLIALATLGIVAVAIIATHLPARRAAAMNPTLALRYE